MRQGIVDAIIIVGIRWIPANKMDPGSSSLDAMMMNNPIKVHHLFKRHRFDLMAVGANLEAP
jgi:hypothetical protein